MALPIHIPDLFIGTVVEWERLGVRDRDRFRTWFLNPLIRAGLLAPTIPGSRTAHTQRYRRGSSCWTGGDEA